MGAPPTLLPLRLERDLSRLKWRRSVEPDPQGRASGRERVAGLRWGRFRLPFLHNARSAAGAQENKHDQKQLYKLISRSFGAVQLETEISQRRTASMRAHGALSLLRWAWRPELGRSRPSFWAPRTQRRRTKARLPRTRERTACQTLSSNFQAGDAKHHNLALRASRHQAIQLPPKNGKHYLGPSSREGCSPAKGNRPPALIRRLSTATTTR